MTLIAAWASLDQKPNNKKQVASLYIASDSRASWGNEAKVDNLQKVFACSKSPDIFGFCGDVNFCQATLINIVSLIDQGILFEVDNDNKHEIVLGFINKRYAQHPKDRMATGSCIYYGTKVGRVFHLFVYYIKDGRFICVEKEMPKDSDVIVYDGSGKKEFKENWIQVNHEKDNNHRTSRNVYHCLAKTIENTSKFSVGGVPQIVGIYRGTNAISFGIEKKERLYLLGHECSENENLDAVEWRNDNFEITNPHTKKLKDGAHAQPFK